MLFKLCGVSHYWIYGLPKLKEMYTRMTKSIVQNNLEQQLKSSSNLKRFIIKYKLVDNIAEKTIILNFKSMFYFIPLCSETIQP